MEEKTKEKKTIWMLFIGLLIAMVAALHYTTPTKLHHFHELYRALFYLPIILSAFRFQLKGGITAAFAVIAIYLPHVVFQWGGDFLYNFSRFLEMLMYLVIGTVAGLFAQRESAERKKYQQAALELKTSYHQLQKQSEKITEIEDRLRTSERLSILGELAATLAHEVRNPLGAIWGVVEILNDEYKSMDRNSEFLDLLNNEVKRLDQVVENYLMLGRRSDAIATKCNLFDLAHSVVLLLTHKARKQNVKLNLSFSNKNLYILSNELQFQQILINLILNSLTALPKGGEIEIKGEASDHSVRLSVVDNGKGIAPENLSEVFKPFFSTSETGTGLGLSIVKRIVEQNKWKLDIQSTVNHGTTVAIVFPAESADESKI
ncbi:MAG TPA: sensor histidine kinase [bacterium]|nr:sensor histidine kinase [bacterium]